MLLSYWTVYRSPCAIKNSQRTTRHRAALNRRVFLDYLRPNRVLLNGWHLDSLSKKANFGDDSETYFWLLSKKRPRCALERALGFSKLSRRASEIKNWQRTTRYKIEAQNSWTPCISWELRFVLQIFFVIGLLYLSRLCRYSRCLNNGETHLARNLVPLIDDVVPKFDISSCINPFGERRLIRYLVLEDLL
jgi:hypothetical protein